MSIASVHCNKVVLRLCLRLRETVLVILHKSYLLQTWPNIYWDQEVPIVVNSHDSVWPDKIININMKNSL